MAMSYKTSESTKYRADFADHVRKEAEKQGWEWEPNKTQHFYVDAVFYFDKINRDCNNYWKIMLDAITDTGLVWIDDNVVCERVQRIYYDPTNPRIELTIHPVEYIGVFDNAPQMERFESVCLECTRHNKNCSILNKAKMGKIQKEVCGLACQKYRRRHDVE